MLSDLIYANGASAFWVNKTARLGSNATGGTTTSGYGSVYGMTQCIHLSSGTITFPIPTSFDMNANSSFTIEMVVVLDESSTYNIFAPYLKLNAGVLEFKNEDNTVRYQVEDKEWHHVVAIHDSNYDQLYINGALVEEIEVDYETHTRSTSATLTGGSFQCAALYNLPLEQAAIDDHSEDAFDWTDENFSVYGAELADFDRREYEESIVFNDETWDEGDYFDISIDEDGYLNPGWDADGKSMPSTWTGVIPINTGDTIGLSENDLTNLIVNAGLETADNWTTHHATIEPYQNIDDDWGFAIVPDETSNDSYISPNTSLAPGIYTLGLVLSVDEENVTEDPHQYARRVVVFEDGVPVQSDFLNTIEDQIDIEITFSFETSYDIRIYNGSEIETDLITLEAAILVEGSEILDYVDETMADVNTSGSGTTLELVPRDVYIEWEGAGAFEVEISQDNETWTTIDKRTALEQFTGDDIEVRVNFEGDIQDDTSEIRAMRADVAIRDDFQLFQVRKTTITGNPFISSSERSPKQMPQEGLYLTASDYITIGANETQEDETIKMVELWIENSATGTILSTTGVTVSNTAGTIGVTGGTIVSNLNLSTKYTILIVVFNTAVNAPIVVKNGHITRLAIYTAGGSTEATAVLNSYLEPLKTGIAESLTLSDVTAVINESTWSIKSSG